jgi:hypothetical protein
MRVVTVKGCDSIYPFTLGPVASTRGPFLRNHRTPLPAVLVRQPPCFVVMSGIA